MLTIYNFLDSFNNINKMTKIKQFLLFIGAPVFYLLEYLCYRYYWHKIVIPEILTSDEIVGMLDKNEFAYDGKVIKKIGLLSENEFFDRSNLEEARLLIKKEYVLTLSELLEKNVALNVEDYITLLVTTEMKVIQDKGENFRDKVYSVTIMFCRFTYLQEMKKKLIYWFLLIFLLGLSGGIIYKFIL